MLNTRLMKTVRHLAYLKKNTDGKQKEKKKTFLKLFKKKIKHF